MNIFFGKEVGKYIGKKIFSAKNYVLICTPSISYDFGEKILQLIEKGIRVKIITSNSGAGETDQVHKIMKKFLESNKILEYKIIDTKEIFNHAKIYIVDGEYAVIGSANFTKESFWNNLESIVMFEESNEVEKVETQFNELWNSYKTTDFICTDKKNEIKKIFHRIKAG